MSDFVTHDRIIGGLATVPDVAARLRDYSDRLGLSVDALKRPGLDFIAPPVPRDGPFYAGRRAATVVGSAGELI